MSGQGSVYKRCGCIDPVTGRQFGGSCPRLADGGHGSWYVGLELPAALDGSRRRIRRGGYPSGETAEAMLASAADAGAKRPHGADPHGWATGWRTGWSCAPAASTVRSYTAHVWLYLAPCLRPVLLAELSAGHVQAMFTAIIRHHQALGTPISAATLNRIRATLRAALNAAIRRSLISENAASRAELPRARRPRAVIWTPERVEHWEATGERPEVAVWTAAQTARFLTASAGHRLYAVYHLIALRGLRRGEAAGLRWCDIDLDGKTAIISQQLQQHGGRMEVTPPKTPYSARLIALDHTTVAVLREHRRRQRAEAACYGPGYQASGYVFTNRGGGPMAPDRLTCYDVPDCTANHESGCRAVPTATGPYRDIRANMEHYRRSWLASALVRVVQRYTGRESTLSHLLARATLRSEDRDGDPGSGRAAVSPGGARSG
jgi:integrase